MAKKPISIDQSKVCDYDRKSQVFDRMRTGNASALEPKRGGEVGGEELRRALCALVRRASGSRARLHGLVGGGCAPS